MGSAFNTVGITIAAHKIALVMDLDPNTANGKCIDCMKEYYMSDKRVLAVHNFVGQGYKDLYMLANIKGAFSEYEIAQIAHQLVMGVGYLHSKDIFLRCLKP